MRDPLSSQPPRVSRISRPGGPNNESAGPKSPYFGKSPNNPSYGAA